jgi:DNA primase
MQSEGIEVYAAFDNDKAGKEFQLKAFANGIKFGVQPQGKDWNDDLRSGVKSADIKAQKIRVSRSQDHGWSR